MTTYRHHRSNQLTAPGARGASLSTPTTPATDQPPVSCVVSIITDDADSSDAGTLKDVAVGGGGGGRRSPMIRQLAATSATFTLYTDPDSGSDSPTGGLSPGSSQTQLSAHYRSSA